MVLTTNQLTVRCLLSMVVIQGVQMDRLWPLEPLDGNQIEDDVDYSVPADLEDVDWSPPNGELPDVSNMARSPFVPDDPLEDLGFAVGAARPELEPDLNFLRRKKNQVLCHVQRAIHHHKEAGQEFFPKSFTSYSCHPVNPSEADGSLTTSHETCYVPGSNCITIEKEQLFLKRRQNTHCWTHFIEAVGAGCKCLSRKY